MDASDDLLRLRTALRYLPALKEDLKSVEVSSTNLHRKLAIVKQLYILEEIIANAMVQVRTSCQCYLTLHLTRLFLLGGQLLNDERGQPQQSWHSSKVAAVLP
jgi:hypothetical protein